jgi:membrane protein DedA with SNARE-associated domain
LKLRVPRRRLDRLNQFYYRYRVWLVLMARFFDGTRQLDGIVAGSARLAWPRFLMFNALGCMAWVTVWGWGTYQLGRHDAAFRLRPLGALGSRSTACRRSDGPANAASPSTR